MSEAPWLVVSSSGPGVFDGIGDFSASLTDALRAHGAAELVVRRASWDELEARDPAGIAGVVIQYFPQAFLRGDLRVMLRWLDRVRAGGKPVVVTIHEYWPPLDGSLRRAGVRLLFRRMLRAFVKRSTAVVVTQDWSAHELTHITRGKTVVVIPVGSNIPSPGTTAPAHERTRDLVMFGQPAAMHPATLSALGAWLNQQPADVTLTWLGRSADEMRSHWCGTLGLSSDRVTFQGALPASDVSRALQSARIGLAPYVNGASTRRTTFAALLQHGLPIVALDGITTSDQLRASDACVWTPEGEPERFVAAVQTLVNDERRRRELSPRAAAFYRDNLSWARIGALYSDVLVQSQRGAA
jgi:glycosyltransferase involved in cell wall biosynthesis